MRTTRDQMGMGMACVVAKRSTCDRLQVGAVISRDGRVISSGYNGNIVGMDHCNHQEHPSIPCTTAVHAEANAILFAARYGMSTEGATLYTTHQPCLQCAKMIINAGIVRVCYEHPYRDNSGLDLLIAYPGLSIAQAVRSQEEVTR